MYRSFRLQTKPPRKRFDEIDVLRGIGAFLMLIGHAITIHNIPEYKPPIPYVFNAIYTFHMPLFFLISGLCFNWNGDDYPGYLAKKARRLLIPYLFFSLVTFILRRILPAFSLTRLTPAQTIINILFKGGEIWFLYVLFTCFLIQPIIQKAFKKASNMAIVVAVSWILYLILPEIEWLCLSSFLFHYPFFLLGIILKKPILRLISETKPRFVLLLSICLLVVDLLFARLKADIEGTLLLERLIRIAQALLGICIAACLTRVIRYKPLTACFKLLGQYSLELYLFNGYFVSVSRTLCGMLRLSTYPTILMNIFFILPLNFLWVYWVTKLKPVRFVCGRP